MPEVRSAKIIPFEAAHARFAALREAGRRIVQSHGIFDLIHPGHIAHLEGARALGDLLVVSVTADRHVHKGPGRPYFAEHLRLASVASLECVDFVVLAPFPGAVEAIETIRPTRLLQGQGIRGPLFDRPRADSSPRKSPGRRTASAAKSASPARSRPARPG
jgi:cytidyltransferase-like protein